MGTTWVREYVTVVYDPAAPTMFLDGLIDIYSTCRDCGNKMKVIRAEDHSHPGCIIVQTELESLADLWLAEVMRGDDEQASETETLIQATIKLTDLQSVAIEYANWEWPTFPLGYRSKAPAIPKPKGRGFKDANTDPERMRRYWRKHPDHNIGLATGHRFDVIDVDTKDSDGNPSPAGVESLMMLLRENCRKQHASTAERKRCSARHLPDVHGVAVTASGGMHLYVQPTGKGNFAALWPGIDYRGLGGYVVAPPSLLRGPGRTYTWIVEPSPIIKGGF